MNYMPLADRRSAVQLTGAVYTPVEVAASIVRFAAGSLKAKRLKVLEPSVGDGAFLGQLAIGMPDHDYVAIDIDEHVIKELIRSSASWPSSLTLKTCEFVEFACNAMEAEDETFDLVIGNPPFIRKRNFTTSFKTTLKRFAELSNYSIAELKNSWAAFLLAAANITASDGIVAFVLPYELLTVSYGHAMLRRMLEVFPRIDLFISDEKAFPSTEQDAVFFWGQRQPSTPRGVFVQRVSEMSEVSEAREHQVVLAAGRPFGLDLSAFLIDPKLMPTLHRLQAELKTFSELATSAPGVVTAANSFFILEDADVERLQLRKYVLPILKRQNALHRSPIFAKRHFNGIAKSQPCWLININGDFDSLKKPVRMYVDSGAKLGIPERYKCRSRRNWYEVPLVKIAPGFFFKRSHGYPRLCINQAKAYTTDTAYGVRPRKGYTMRGLCFSFYNSLTMFFAETNGRFYGGGVLELSPNELKGLPIVYHEPTKREFEAFLKVHKDAGGDPTPILDFGDRWLAKQPGMKGVDLKEIRKAWISVRSHRLRHSGRSNV